MTQEMWITLSILFVAIVFFVTERLRVDVVALAVVVALMLTGILTTSEALAGFSSSAVLLIASLFIVGGAIFQTGLAAMLGQRILQIAGTSQTRLMIVIMAAVAVMSGFMSDTGVVAVMLPAIVSLAASVKLNPSKLLIPLAFASLLGGAGTLIGTPPNIIINELLLEESAKGTMIAGQIIKPFGFFSFTPLAIVLIIVGILYMISIGRHLLPNRKPEIEVQQAETPGELLEVYKLPDNLFRLRVRSKSRLIEQSIGTSGIGQKFEINILELLRPPQAQTVARLGDQRLILQGSEHKMIHPKPETVLQRDDLLIVKGSSSEIGRTAAYWNLAIQPATASDRESIISGEVGIAEIVLPPRSSLIGKTLVDTHFGSAYNLTVLDIKRSNISNSLDLKATRLRFGDTLLIQGEWKHIFRLKHKRRDFIVMGETETINLIQGRPKAPIALFILICMLLLLVVGNSLGISATTATMVAALAVILTGCLTMDDAYNAIDWKSIVLIAGMLPMSTALTKVGLVDLIADGFINTLGSMGPLAVMAGLFLLTTVFTQVLSNTTTAVLIAPIAFTIAQNMPGGAVQPYAFLMTVAIAASTAFASPVASPVNTLVMGAGNYHFSDYIKIGVPMIVLALIVTLIGVPILFPF